MDKYFYIYDLKQAKYFIDAGLKVLEIGVGSKGDVFLKFLRYDRSESVCTRWKEMSPNADAEVKRND